MSRRNEEEPGKRSPNILLPSEKRPLGCGHASQGSANLGRLVEVLKTQYESPGIAANLEVLLDVEGLLSILEDAGILPVVEDVNPFDPELEEDLNEQWWEKNPEAMERFRRNCEQRDEVLKLLYVGFLLGELGSLGTDSTKAD